MTPPTIYERGERPCRECGEIHDCYRFPDGWLSWAKNGHPYYPESWESLARRCGFPGALDRAANRSGETQEEPDARSEPF